MSKARYYSLSLDAFTSELEAALLDFYGAGVTIESSGSDLVFQCPAICDKTLMISRRAGHGNFRYLYGTVDGVAFSGGTADFYSGSGACAPSVIHAVLADNFILIQHWDSGRVYMSSSILVAKVTSGRFLCMGAWQGDYGWSKCLFTDDLDVDRPVKFITPRTDITAQSNQKMPCFKSAFTVGTELELNPDGSVAYIDGLYLSMLPDYVGMVGLNYYLSKSILRGSNAQGVYMPNAFYVPIELQE